MPKLGMEPIRKDALIKATIVEIGRSGSLDVTVSQIAKRAGMSSALAHHYFGSKEEIFLAAMRHILSLYGAEVRGALAVAVVVKLARVVMLAPVIAVVSIRQRRMADQAANLKRPPLVPLFVVAFLACAALRTSGVLPAGVLATAKLTQTAFLTAAMFALGTGVNIAALRKVGLRPFGLAAISTVWVAGIALTGVLLAG